MRWKKLGLVYGPDGSLPWAMSHAIIPTPIRLNNEVVRVFVGFCDDKGVGRPGYVDLDARNLLHVLDVSQKPLLDLGKPGTFDENGVLPSAVLNLADGRMFMYYVGFELGTQIRYRLLTGLAISEDGGFTFTRYANSPILERTSKELYFRAAPYCMYMNQRFRLWYVAGSEWTEINGKSMPVYDIRYAESFDGVHWPAHGELQLGITEQDEHAVARPSVIITTDGRYRMFYSVRRRSFGAYRLGYAESMDGRNWKRMDDQLNLDVTPGAFDSAAIMYAAPIEIDGKLYVFYNGNDFGRDGFAVALLEEE